MKTLRSLILSVLLAMLAIARPLLAQEKPPQPAPLGVVATATSARLGNASASQGATVYSGDFLSTDGNGSLLVRVGAVSIELQDSSSAHIYRAPYGAVLELNSGSAVYAAPGSAAQNVVIFASDVRVTPALNLPDFGRVSIVDSCNVTVQSQRGQANVRVGSESHLVEEGKAYRVRVENSISYRKYVSPEDADYHDYHEHKPCAAPWQTAKGRLPRAPSHSDFLYLASGVITLATVFAVSEAVESPNRP